jgi:hypothetical protein
MKPTHMMACSKGSTALDRSLSQDCRGGEPDQVREGNP